MPAPSSSKPTAVPGDAPASTDGGRQSSKLKPRSRAREFALQALYQLIVGQQDVAAIDTYTRDLSGFAKCDSAHYDALVHGVAAQRDALDALITPALDRPLAEISPIERAVLWLGTFELQTCVDVPFVVAINEYVDLAKDFGGTDGFKYINAVLNRLAAQLRSAEVQAYQSQRGRRAS